MVSEKETRMTQLHWDIHETKRMIQETEGQGWPFLLAIVGLVLTPFIIGIFIVIGAIAWAIMRSNETAQLRVVLAQYEGELSRLEIS